MDFSSYLLQHPVSSIVYILAAIGYTVALLSIYKDYKTSKKLSRTQKAVLIALGCSLSLWRPPQFLENNSPASIFIGMAVFVLTISLIVIFVFKINCRTSKK